ncbi:hypothetical protein EBF04_02045 [Streptomyces sp. I6]|nr:hypothetical protein EBF04_02045 [Streptomyces sp. I6]
MRPAAGRRLHGGAGSPATGPAPYEALARTADRGPRLLALALTLDPGPTPTPGPRPAARRTEHGCEPARPRWHRRASGRTPVHGGSTCAGRRLPAGHVHLAFTGWIRTGSG